VKSSLSNYKFEALRFCLKEYLPDDLLHIPFIMLPASHTDSAQIAKIIIKQFISMKPTILFFRFFTQMYAPFSAMVDQPSNGKGLKYGSSRI